MDILDCVTILFCPFVLYDADCIRKYERIVV